MSRFEGKLVLVIWTTAMAESSAREGNDKRDGRPAIGAPEQFVIWYAVQIGGELGGAKTPHRQPALEALDA